MDRINGVCYTRDLDEYKRAICVQDIISAAFGKKPVSLGIDGLWFNMLACGWKKEEYREIKPFNNSRLGSCVERKSGGLLLLTNGRQSDSPRMALRFSEVSVGVGKPEWGAPGFPVYRIFIESVLLVYRPERLCNKVFRYPWYGSELNVEVGELGEISRRLVTEK